MQDGIAVIGAGTLGRRIALMFSTRGGEVRLFDSVEGVAQSAAEDVRTHQPKALSKLEDGRPAEVRVARTLAEAVEGAWLVVEAVPEDRALKVEIFGKLDTLSAPDAILATNSSSFPSSEMLDNVERRERVLNLHFYMPPLINAVELMSCGQTSPEVLEKLVAVLPHYGLSPYVARRESVGFIFNRIWAAIKRESLQVVAEGVAVPADVDAMFQHFTGNPVGPFRRMDAVGLDVVLAIEEHYAHLDPTIREEPRALLRQYVDKGWLGAKTGRGFYEY